MSRLAESGVLEQENRQIVHKKVISKTKTLGITVHELPKELEGRKRKKWRMGKKSEMSSKCERWRENRRQIQKEEKNKIDGMKWKGGRKEKRQVEKKYKLEEGRKERRWETDHLKKLEEVMKEETKYKTRRKKEKKEEDNEKKI